MLPNKDVKRNVSNQLLGALLLFWIFFAAYYIGAFRPIHELGHVLTAKGAAHVTGWSHAYIENPTPNSIIGGHTVELGFWLGVFFFVYLLAQSNGYWPPFLLGAPLGVITGAYIHCYISYDVWDYAPAVGYDSGTLCLTWAIIATPLLLIAWAFMIKRFTILHKYSKNHKNIGRYKP